LHYILQNFTGVFLLHEISMTQRASFPRRLDAPEQPYARTEITYRRHRYCVQNG